MTEIITMMRGSDVDFTRFWPATDGSRFDLTDWTVYAFEPHADLLDSLTLTKGDAEAGEIIGRIEWDDRFETGTHMGFQIGIRRGEQDITTHKYMIKVTASARFADEPLPILPTGPQGPQGADGLSSYEVAVAGGYVGSAADWLASLVGPKGDDGAASTVPGPAGADGSDGQSVTVHEFTDEVAAIAFAAAATPLQITVLK
ncbi:hypothetical protein EOK75_14110 (plasmid) [Pseudorhodobacter turbinis]|uniref:Uncharacterized protein n=1 Tax=Pseudorhodobacter turbinis TaxID=2500533 RepID=A0A4P8EIH1_9RHOB|nr:hypothetical protein [Pseudorhodobacter turbinis]QCO56931.1 hypothetical protein EOK75_14110 [Pseudorhodobacter turbinis]